MSKFKKN